MNRLRMMESFVSVVRCGNFSAAAHRLGIPRSVVSKHISLLEQHLGARLFNRTTRLMSPTEAGLEYFEIASRTIEELERRENEIRKSQQQASGLLKVLVPSSLGLVYFSDAIRSFAELHPHVRISLALSDYAPQAQDLYEGGIDVAIRLSEIQSGSLIARRLGVLRWVLCAAPSYVATTPAITEPPDLKQLNCLVHTGHSPDRVWRFCGEREFHVRVSGSLSSNNAFILRNATLSGKGVAILPEYVCFSELNTGELIALLPALTVVPERPVYVLYADRRFLPRRVQLFVDFISDWLTQPSLHFAVR